MSSTKNVGTTENVDTTKMSSTKNVNTTVTVGDCTITYTKVDGRPQAYVTSTSAKVVTIPASFGRRPKTGKSQEKNATAKDADTHCEKWYIKVDTKPKHPYWVNGDEDETRLEDEDFEDISERGAWEYGA